MSQGRTIPQEVVYRFFRHVLRTSVYAYARNLAVTYHELKRRTSPDLRGEIARLEALTVLREHYHEKEGLDGVSLSHLKNQLGGMQLLVRSHLQRGLEGPMRILEVGDPDGSLRLVLGGAHKYVSVNISADCVRAVRQAGGCPIQADLEGLPFPDETFDVVLCFETVEHLKNPIRGLGELARVTADRVLVSIPWVPMSRIHPRRSSTDCHDLLEHVFEFSPDDFPKILTHTPLSVERYDGVDVFPKIKNPFHRWVLRSYFDPSHFPAFQFYVLKKNAPQDPVIQPDIPFGRTPAGRPGVRAKS